MLSIISLEVSGLALIWINFCGAGSVDTDVDVNDASELVSESLLESPVELYSTMKSAYFFCSRSFCFSLLLFSHAFFSIQS